MKTYLINLDRSPGRLAFMTGQLQAQRIEFERIAAVDGAKLDASAWPGRHLGIIGCFLSHRNAWQRLLSTEASHAAVLEDDAWLSPDLATILREESWIPGDADVVKIETTGTKVFLSSQGYEAPCKRTVRRLQTIHEGSAGYIISRSGARRLLDMSGRVPEPVDFFMFSQRALASSTVYQMVPALVRQRSTQDNEAIGEFSSTIDADRFAGRKSMLRIFRGDKLYRELTRPFRDMAALVRRFARTERSAEAVAFR